MNIKINPKYKIGQRIKENIYKENSQKIVFTREFIINNIEAIYDLKNAKTKYKYELAYTDKTLGDYKYGWIEI